MELFLCAYKYVYIEWFSNGLCAGRTNICTVLDYVGRAPTLVYTAMAAVHMKQCSLNANQRYGRLQTTTSRRRLFSKCSVHWQNIRFQTQCFQSLRNAPKVTNLIKKIPKQNSIFEKS